MMRQLTVTNLNMHDSRVEELPTLMTQ